MAGRPSSARMTRLTGPLKLLTQRFAFLLLLGLSMALLVLGRADPLLLERGRAYVVDVSAPVLQFLSRPAEAISDIVAEFRAVSDLYGENEALREENRRLRDWQTAARKLEQENVSLRSLLSLRPEPRTTVVAARVIADGGGPFVRTVVIDAGTETGVEDGHVVLDGAGVVGRITAAGRVSSRVLLLTDLNSRIPVRFEGTRQRAVLAGDNSDRPRLAFLPGSAKIHPGDRLVTSGDGGLYPAGLPVGVVETVGPDGIRVRPWSGLETLEYVRVVRYDARSLALDGIEDDARALRRKLAPKAPVSEAEAEEAARKAAASQAPPAAAPPAATGAAPPSPPAPAEGAASGAEEGGGADGAADGDSERPE